MSSLGLEADFEKEKMSRIVLTGKYVQVLLHVAVRIASHLSV